MKYILIILIVGSCSTTSNTPLYNTDQNGDTIIIFDNGKVFHRQGGWVSDTILKK